MADTDAGQVAGAGDRVDVGIVTHSGARGAEVNGCDDLLGEHRLDRVSEDGDGGHAWAQRRQHDPSRGGRHGVAEAHVKSELDARGGDARIDGDAHSGVEGVVADRGSASGTFLAISILRCDADRPVWADLVFLGVAGGFLDADPV